MSKAFFFIFFFCLPISFAFPQAKTGKGDTEETIKQLEQRRYALMVKKDLDGLRDLLGDDLVYTHSSGVTENKEQFIQAIASGTSVYYDVQPEEVQIRLYGNTAIVNGIGHFDTIVDGQRTILRLKYTDAYVKRNGKWQLVTWQSLRLAK